MVRKILIIMAIFLTSSALVNAQTGSVSGKIVDGKGLPLIGANVVVKGTTNGTITDIDGNYTIPKVNVGEQIIVASFIGFSNQESSVTIREGQITSVNFTLIEDITTLDELVVIGYGTVKKEDATGSVVAIKSDDFNQGAITTPQELVSGKIAGVQITTDGGAPGAGATIRIRGGSSLSASNDPLIVIDGVPVSSGGIDGMANPLATINPNDIETFTVLKDASATAIYGSRASNGVIIITTKKGKKGKPLSISYSGKLSVNKRAKSIDVLNADEYRAVVAEQEGEDSKYYKVLGNANTNWQEQIFQTGLTQDHNISLSGSLMDIPYRFSGGYTGEKGILLTSKMDRYTGSVGLNPSFFDDFLKVNLNFKGVHVENRFADQGAIGGAMEFDPTQPVYDPTSPFGGYYFWSQVDNDGNIMTDTVLNNPRPNTLAVRNPVAQLNQKDDKSSVNRVIGNIQFDYKLHFFPDIKMNLNLGIDYSKSDGDITENGVWNFVPDSISIGNTNPFFYNRTYYQNKSNKLLDFYFNYNKEIDAISSKIDAMLGYSWQHFYRENGYTEIQPDLSIPVKSEIQKTEYYLVSFFGRLNYTLMDKYLFTFTLRNDGSSRFSPDTRWGLFPSAAFAWNMNKESFLENVTVLSELKLRLGYGLTGQQEINQGDYPYLAIYTFGQPTAQYLLGDTFYTTARPNGYDANIKWEETKTYNAGLDFGLLDDRITGAIDIYKRKTSDLLNYVPIPIGSNLTNRVITNVGDLENNGFEFSITGRPISSKDMNWEIGFNMTYNKNKITKLTNYDDPGYNGIEVTDISGAVGNTIQIHSVGYAANTYYVFEQVYDENGKPIEGVYVDRNHDGVWNDEDKYRYHKPSPDFIFGFNSKFEYMNFDLSLTARANLGNYVYNNLESNLANYQQLNHSSGFNKNLLAAITKTDFEKPQYWSDYYIQNASFLKIDNITLGYNFKDLGIGNLKLRIYGAIQNAFVFTKYSGLDPEVFNGIDYNIYPRPRIYMVGLNLNF